MILKMAIELTLAQIRVSKLTPDEAYELLPRVFDTLLALHRQTQAGWRETPCG